MVALPRSVSDWPPLHSQLIMVATHARVGKECGLEEKEREGGGGKGRELTECEAESALDEVHKTLEGGDDGVQHQLEEVHDGSEDSLEHLQDRLEEVRHA